MADGPDKLKIGELREFAERYAAAWASRDPDAVAACCHPGVVWEDPVLPEPARGPAAVADFARSGFAAFSDLAFEDAGEPALATDKTVAFMPWRMMGTNDGPIDPPGFPPSGRFIDITGVDEWSFRDGKLWRYRAIYDGMELARQLGRLPAAGSRAEQAMVKLAQLRAKIPA